jgi:NHLM bacteriocin system ABC transporter ATP-binding protein
MNVSLAQLFDRKGETLSISGVNPVLLEGRDSVWCVLDGSVEVFAIRMEENRLVGRKNHLFSARQGECLFGLDADSPGAAEQALQAVGIDGTLLSRMDLGRLLELCSIEPLETQLTEAIDQWLEWLSQALTRDIVPRPQADILLEPSRGLEAEKGKVFSPQRGVQWIRHQSGMSLFIGMEEVGPSIENRLLPVCAESWIETLEASRFDMLSTREMLFEGLFRPSFDAFHAMLFQLMLLNTGLAAADGYNLLREKAQADRAMESQGYAELASVLAGKATLPAGKGSDDQAIAAFGLVARKLGIPFQGPPKSRRQQEKRTWTIEDLARASRINIRRVALRPGWWKQDNGPLLGFLEDGGKAVALLPVTSTHYEVVDPAEGTSRRIRKEAEGAGLSPFAFTLYRRLPEKALGGMDLLEFGLPGCWKDMARVFLLGGAAGIVNLVIPIATGLIFSELIPEAERTRLIQIFVLIVCFTLTTGLFEITRNIALLRIESRLETEVTAALWDRLLRLPLPFFRGFTAGDLAMRGMGLSMMRQALTGPAVTTIVGSLFFVFSYGLLFYYDLELASIATVVLLAALLVVACAALIQLRFFRRMADTQGNLAGRVFQFLSAITKLRVAGAENRAFALWAKDFSSQQLNAYRGGLASICLTTFISLFPLFSLMVLFSWLIFAKGSDTLSTGDFLAFNAAFSSLQASLFQFVIALGMFVQALPFLERARPILESSPEVNEAKTDPGQLSGRVELYHVFFRYSPEGPLILKDISMQIEPGEFVAIVGPSGSGKSTLFRLLLGFEKPESGAIYYDDQDLSELDVSRARQNLGVVMQGSSIMPGDLFTNIVGSRPLTMDDAWEAARMVGLDEEIRQMPMSMHTIVMEGASTLSGGQKQRLMIARAIINRPRILLFDEATSALDNRTQAIVSHSLKMLKATRVVIAHRLSTIRDADRIYVLDGGEIVESGVYEELLQKDGLFAKIARRQIA